jgi:hypothetical protein
LKKVKEYKKFIQEELDKGKDEKDILVDITNEFLKEFTSIENTSDSKILNKAKELDVKFQSMLPKDLKYLRHLFRLTIINHMPSIKKRLMW